MGMGMVTITTIVSATNTATIGSLRMTRSMHRYAVTPLCLRGTSMPIGTVGAQRTHIGTIISQRRRIP
jgi:hypothetical protein